MFCKKQDRKSTTRDSRHPPGCPSLLLSGFTTEQLIVLIESCFYMSKSVRPKAGNSGVAAGLVVVWTKTDKRIEECNLCIRNSEGEEMLEEGWRSIMCASVTMRGTTTVV